ncbi:MAG: hypothetical protein H8D63_00255 [Parcubacteria group bacterium]|nr:hypothetical protein [Parcubacteria group bacterium]
MNTKHLALFGIPLLALGLAGTAFASGGFGPDLGEKVNMCSLSQEERDALRAEHETTRAEHQVERVSDIATITGIPESVIEEAFETRTPMHELFDEYGVDGDEVHNELRAQREEHMEVHIAELVAEGTITQEEANERIAHMEERGMGGPHHGKFGDSPRNGEEDGCGKRTNQSSEE